MMQVMTVTVMMMLMITSMYFWTVAAHPWDCSDVKKKGMDGDGKGFKG